MSASRSTFKRLGGGKRPTRKHASLPHGRSCVEPLEDRRLFGVGPVAAAGLPVGGAAPASLVTAGRGGAVLTPPVAGAATGNTSTSAGPLSTAAAPTADVTEFPIPTADSRPDGITRGPDGNLWFAEPE